MCDNVTVNVRVGHMGVTPNLSPGDPYETMCGIITVATKKKDRSPYVCLKCVDASMEYVAQMLKDAGVDVYGVRDTFNEN